ncbi:MAG: ABC transporter ATP-binding protein [Candidatus Latescibacteria bacterium]|nr:ABC transporter ATP-binding protein [Candidatus Latescibacterota bacterium]
MHTPDASNESVLVVEDLIVDFTDYPHVLNGVNLSLKRGEILGLVGESGAGKSVLARCLIRLESPADIVSGSIILDGLNLTTAHPRELNKLRGNKIFLAMQNPQSAMDPVFTMGYQFREILLSRNVSIIENSAANNTAGDIYSKLRSTGIASPEARCRQYPHEWSRGMLQRAQLVMAFLQNPEVVILDEVTTALDPTITLQILDLIIRFKEQQGTGIILITHDLAVVSEVCDRVAIMRKGRIVETGTVRDILSKPVHPYTCLLLSSITENTN